MCKRSVPPVDAAHLDAATAPPPRSKASSPALLPTYTRADLARHNSPTSAWCAVHNVDPATGVPLPGHAVLDVTAFAAVHPGGDLILLAAGRDASVLFETYHPRGVPPKLVAKLTIGTMAAGSYADTLYSWRSDFYRVLKRRVVQRLEERGLARRGSTEIWIKAALLLAGFWGCLLQMYAADCATPHGCAAAAAWAVGMGVCAALIGVNVQHDGNHGAFATSRLPNKAAGWTLDMIGASAFTWELQHMLGHHPYTNVLDVEEEGRKGEKGEAQCGLEEKDQESDPDVFSSFPLMRMHPFHAPSWFHRYQHLYAPFLFAFMTLGKVFQQDYEVALSKRLYHIDATCRYGCAWNVVRFWSMKFLTMVYMMALPVYFHGIAKGVALFMIGHFACGELLATMFIVNHVIEGISYAQKGGTGGAAQVEEDDAGKTLGTQTKVVSKPATLRGDTPMEKSRRLAAERNGHDSDREAVPDVPLNDWAAIQCQTSVNWAPGSWFWNHFSGGLSHQIEHHLFPSICHTNYAYFHDIVEATCREYGVPYQSEPSLRVAYGKMLRHLKHLGRGKGE